MLAPWKKSYKHPRQHVKKQRHYFTNKVSSRQSYSFSNSHVWMWELDQKEGWAPKNWCFWTVIFEKTLESFLDKKEIKLVNPKGNQPWIFIGRTEAEAEALILWPPDVKNWLFRKDTDAGKNWRQRRREWQRMRWLDSITALMNMNSSKLWEIVKTGKLAVLQSMSSQSQIRFSNSTTKSEKNKALLWLD